MKKLSKNEGESKGAYLSRFMENEDMVKLYPNGDTRYAACMSVEDPELAQNLSFNKDDETISYRGLRHLMSDLVSVKPLEGQECLVIPTILIVEGVHNNVFYPASELKKFPDSWNGRPVVINHPDLNGAPITANSPDIVERQTVGSIYNVKYEDGKLKGEVWINIEKCKKISPEILEQLHNNEHVEVSTGLFTECDGEGGEWNGEKYIGTVYNYRPDHLALLPNDVGACSWEDGAGMCRNNENKKTENEVGSVIQAMSVNELSHGEIWLALSNLLDSTFGTDMESRAYVVEVYGSYLIYAKINEGTSNMFKQNYIKNADDSYEFEGSAIEVRESKEFVPVTVNAETEKESNMDKDKFVSDLIANSDWTDEDKELLLNMSEEQLTRLAPKANAEDAEDETGKKEEATPEANEEGKATDKEGSETPKENKEDKPKTADDLIANIEDPEIKATLNRALARDRQTKSAMVAELMSNESCKYSEAQLINKEIEELEILINMLSGSEDKKASDFSLRNPAIKDNADEDAIPPMPSVFEKK